LSKKKGSNGILSSGGNSKGELYKDDSGNWRWRLRAGNNKIVAASTEGYVNKSDAKENARKFGPKGAF
jgi:uncharacterized protein YegP (UPF0339 family)